MTRSFAGAVYGSPEAEVLAKPVKKGLSAGTAPPATDQVPFGGTQQATSSTPAGPSTQPSGSSNSRKASSGSTNDAHMSSATVGVDRPSAAAVPAGVDQVPPSSTAHTASAHTVPQDDSTATDPPTPARKQSMQSVLKDVSDIGQLNQGPSRTPDASEASDAAVGRWQRFKWWIWGTPQQYWTHPDSNKPHSSTSGAAHAAASTTHDGGPSRKRSRWSIADIMASAILRSGITKDDDVARFASKSAAIAIYTLAGFSLLGTLGVDTKPLVAGLGVGGFTVGFALRDVATNFVSGVLLVLQRPFEKGNKLRVHAGSTILEGEVQSIELRYIVLKPKDQSIIMIPASIVYANPVVVVK
ncbi:hypothetical protein ABBQ32_000170 [Trebouxia sp. C0010 RCD-2024]